MLIEAIAKAPFGASVSDFDCANPTAAELDRLRSALHLHQLLVFPGQAHLTPEQEVAFCRGLDLDGSGVWRDQTHNPWEVFKVEQGNLAGTYQLPDQPAVLVLGKGDIDHYGLRVTLGGARDAYGEDEGSQVLGGGALQWHIDGTFYGHAPCNYTQMRCIEAPAGDGHWLAYNDGSGDRLWCAAGATAFASGRIAHDLLDRQDLDFCRRTRVHYASRPFETSYGLGNSANGLRLLDGDAESRHREGKDTPGGPVDDDAAQVYPLLWHCPQTGRDALMPQPRCMHALEWRGDGTSRFLGVVESRLRVEGLMRPAIDPARVYVHAWQPGDIAIWYNRSVWHSATGELAGNDRRVMHLTAFNGSRPPPGPTDRAVISA